MLKRCCHCKQEKSLENFTRNNATKDGLELACRDCKRGYGKSLYEPMDRTLHIYVGSIEGARLGCRHTNAFDLAGAVKALAVENQTTTDKVYAVDHSAACPCRLGEGEE